MLVSFSPYSMFNLSFKESRFIFNHLPPVFHRAAVVLPSARRPRDGASAPQLALSTTHPAGHVRTDMVRPLPSTVAASSTSTPRASDTVPRERRPCPTAPAIPPAKRHRSPDLARTRPRRPPSRLDTPSHARSQDPTLEAIKQKRLAELGGMEGMPQSAEEQQRAKRRLRREQSSARGSRVAHGPQGERLAESPLSSRIRPRRSKTCCCRRRRGVSSAGR